MFSGIGSTIAQGMAFGTGSAVAHRAVDSVMGPRTIQHEAVEAASASAAPAGSAMLSSTCDIHAKAFQDVSFKSFSHAFTLSLYFCYRIRFVRILNCMIEFVLKHLNSFLSLLNVYIAQ
ncbi:CHCH domain protein [Arabidopsis thaliana]|nr:CHCH domain protein [Arabidopsis thaliana]ANM69707.1 CHCH domain protein [Arabidopsis thaliana]|eukprot:NP_001331367.1 CHCH domain protein [Arabidopsis thaliana]